jgi:hypothetical protein
MDLKNIALLLSFLLAEPSWAAPVTYQFDGTVFSASGIYSSEAVGAAVTGTYTIDFENAVASQGIGIIGSTASNWTAQAQSGSAYANGLLSQPLVFSSTLQGGAVSYSTTSVGSNDYANNSFITGGPSNWEAYELVALTSGNNYTTSQVVLDGANYPYSSTGLPNFDGATAVGSIEADVNGSISLLAYKVTTLNELSTVPLPSAAWFMISGLAGILVWARRKVVVSAERC